MMNFLHLKQPLWCQCIGAELEKWAEKAELTRQKNRWVQFYSVKFHTYGWSYMPAPGYIPDSRDMTRICLNPKSSGSRETRNKVTQAKQVPSLSATQAATPGAYRLLILSLSVSLSHTHTQDTVIVTLCFRLESLTPSLTSPDLPENWEMWMIWEYGCFFYSEVKYWISYLGLENRGLPCSQHFTAGVLAQLIRKLKIPPPPHIMVLPRKKKKKGLYTFFSVPFQ